MPMEFVCLRLGGVAATLGLLTACAAYRPLPLPERAVPRIPMLNDTGQPLRLTDIERRVLQANPELRSARARRRVAQAQMQQAGLLPDPALGGGIGYLLSGPGDTTAWTATLGEDVQALVTFKRRRNAARADAAQVDADLLWQEWQIIGKARLLVVDIVENERLLDVQRTALHQLEQRSERLQRSVALADTDLASAAPDIAAASEASIALDDLQRQLLSQRQELAALMGWPPDTVLWLVPALDLGAVDDEQARREADTLARRRPDLIALQLGYRAQDERLRAAILAQFPMLSIGYGAAQDNSQVRSAGPSLTIALPLFDRNQGHVAIERATRQQLHDEYEVRLQVTRDEVLALLAQHRQTVAQQSALAPQLAHAKRQAAQARAAARDGLIDIRSRVDLETAASTRSATAIVLQRTAMEQQVAIATLLGSGMPDALSSMVVPP